MKFDDIELGKLYTAQLNYYVFIEKNSDSYEAIVSDEKEIKMLTVSRKMWDQVSDIGHAFVFYSMIKVYNKYAARNIVEFVFRYLRMVK